MSEINASKPIFEDLGFFKEYYIEGKFIGTIHCEKDRDVIGYQGRKAETTSEDILLDNKKKIRKGTAVSTYLYPFCGKSTKS